jgi:methylenetetrahydrofolate dehydrogenase (NADP+)/methenyltetrahydrofolate cyclohydrolase
MDRVRRAAVPRARALDGRALAKRLEATLKSDVAALVKRYGKAPGLAVVLVGEDEASGVYVERKRAACKRVGIASRDHHLPADVSEDALVGLIGKLNGDADMNGILVQLPLPGHIDEGRIIRAIVPYKDVDAFHPQSVGHALLGNDRMAPCTPQGILLLLDDAQIPLAGADIVIVNNSNIVGKPLAALLINRDATVTVCQKETKDVRRFTREADIVVTGTAGKRPLTAADVRPGAVVVDVSIIREDDGTVHGDVADDVWEKAAWVTPVPGGVGPMTIQVLMQNTVRSFRRKMGELPPP